MKVFIKNIINLKENSIVLLEKKGCNFLVKYNDEVVAEEEIGDGLSDLFKYRNQYNAIVESSNKLKVILFCDLHRHSEYSILDGANKINNLVKYTEYAGALTDHGNMFASLEYYKQMKRANKKPIIGTEVYCESLNGSKDKNHLVLIAKNEEGYKNLIKLSSKAWGNIYYKPHVKHEWLKKYGKGIICLTACLYGGELSKYLEKDDYKGGKKLCEKFIEYFGKDNFYLEVQRHELDIEKKVHDYIFQLSKELDVKVVATTDSHYTKREDDKIHEYLLCMQTGKTINEPHFKFRGTNYHLQDSEEMMKLWADHKEVVINTLEVADKVSFEFNLKNRYMPKFDVPLGFKDESEYFESLCWKGFDERFKGTIHHKNEEYIDRLKFEISTIKNMGFPGYFLIVADFINFAKEENILVGPGRGSACGSLVAYCLKITEIEPIKYGLLFERFLNPERVSMPDIDVDIEDTRREEVINYVRRKYGEFCVSRIVTFMTMASKAVIRDVSRVLGKSVAFGDKIAKSIPDAPKMTLEKAYNESPEFKNLYESDEEIRKVVDIAKKLEGMPKSLSQHACGVLIAPKNVDDFIPQIMIKNEDTGEFEPTTQYNMVECEEMGILKMDFLGLRTMGVIGRALKDINKKREKQGLKPLTFNEIPIDDVETYKFISKGNTQGVFQLESAGMTEFMKKLFQDADQNNVDGEQLFERLIAGISLYRPGPIDEIPNYIENMLNPEKIKYDLPQLEPILKNTYNVIVYQEQCMFIVRELAGFSKGDADNVRKAFSKKKTEMIEPLGKKFLHGELDENNNIKTEGCLRRNIGEDVAIKIWNKMEKFGSYAFNKSHAGGYATIGIKTAWISCHYPVEFFTAMLNSYIEAKSVNTDKIKMYLSHIKRIGIEILPPDINKSLEYFIIDDDRIRFGLKGIRNMNKISTCIIEERDIRGEFASFQDFSKRMAIHYKIDSRVLTALVYSGAVDDFEGTRKAKIEMIPLLKQNAKNEKDHTNQMSIFDMLDGYDEDTKEELSKLNKIEIPDIEEFENRYKLEKEKEYSGYYMTSHPLDEYEKYFNFNEITEIGYLKMDKEENIDIKIDKRPVNIAGVIKNSKLIITKNNDLMKVFTIEDRTGEMNVVIFPKDYNKYQDMIYDDAIVLLKGNISDDDRGTQIIAKSVVDVETLALKDNPQFIAIKGNTNIEIARNQFLEIKKNLKNMPNGMTKVFFVFNNKRYLYNRTIKSSYNFINSIQNIVSENNVIVKYKK